MSEQTGRDAIDALRGDMAGHQRRFGADGMATDSANTRMATELVDRIAKEQAEAKPVTPGLNAIPSAEPERIATREINGSTYLTTRGGDQPDLVKPATPEQAWFLPRATARILKLLSLPDTGVLGAASWATKVKAVFALKNKSNAWLAAAAQPAELLRSRHQLERDQSNMKRMGLETISQLTPAFARAKAAELNSQYLAQFVRLLEDSNTLGFGDWKAETAQTLYSIATPNAPTRPRA